VGWIRDNGYEPVYKHEGWTASVLTDGTDTSASSRELSPRVTGWRPACDCGWRGSSFYPRAEYPSEHGQAPDEVEGWETDTGCYEEWNRHLHEAVPELRLYTLAQTIEHAQRQLDDAVTEARAGGASWTTIGRAAGMTRQSAHERWESWTRTKQHPPAPSGATQLIL
jgi:hypothetical protein